MNMEKNGSKDLYYTKDHEWIDFKGAIAYTGICAFKLTGFKTVQRIVFQEASGFKKRGEIIAFIHYNDYCIEATMPVDGKIIMINEELLSGNRHLLAQVPESHGWIAKIAPSQPYERKDLLLPKEYQMNGKSKYAK